MKNAYYTINQDRNGIEIYFPEKPDESTRSALKFNGWRWNVASGCWYIKDSDERRKFAEEITGGAAQKGAAFHSNVSNQTNKFGIKAGDLFVASWGYEQTNLSFLQVVEIVGECSVRVREVSLRMQEERPVSGMSHDVSFVVSGELLPPKMYSSFIADQQRGDLKRIRSGYDANPEKAVENCFIRLDIANAYRYRGEMLYESWYA